MRRALLVAFGLGLAHEALGVGLRHSSNQVQGPTTTADPTLREIGEEINDSLEKRGKQIRKATDAVEAQNDAANKKVEGINKKAREDPITAKKDPTLKEAGKEVDDAHDALAKKKHQWEQDMAHGPGHHGNAKKPMMNDVDVMKAHVCWNRNKLLEHEACMIWLVNACKKQTSGDGYCRKFRTYLKAKCRKGKGCDYAKQLGINVNDGEKIASDDMDGDGVKDTEDAFPDNPLEWKDSDGDNMGDNTDRWPNDPNRAYVGEAPSAAPAGAPGPSPAPFSTGLPKNGAKIPLPSQGYNEHSSEKVQHEDQVTMTADWRAEWPGHKGNKATSVKDICADNPKLTWCKLKQSRAARKAYANSHP